ncbi:MAG TPA: cytochrome c biogenesis protein CcsA [Bryobacteraceae bacterium]|nr:cytochrome c biogenesis protein CcsA [Bryobacteraceae bacterium]
MLHSLFDASVWTSLAAAAAAAVSSILFLRSRNFLYDSLALAVTEIGLILIAAGIVAGAVAGRLGGGPWWSWDARLTSALVGFLIYAPYLMLRRAIEEPTRRAASAAVVSIFAIFDLPIMTLAVNWWLAHHAASAPIGVEWTVLPVAALAAALSWIRLRREQDRRARDAERRAAQEI